MVAISKSNPFYGAQGAPHYITGATYLPPGFSNSGSGITTTVNRCYYVPFVVWEARTFQAVSTYNQGVGDNGKKIRMMVFNDNGAIGGPGTLAKDFGEITLTGAAALRTLSSSWATTPGIYWGAVWFNSASDIGTIEQFNIQTAVGSIGGSYAGAFFGDMGFTGAVRMAHCHYVDTSYGAAPSTAVAPTASIGTVGAVVVGGMPIFGLKA